MCATWMSDMQGAAPLLRLKFAITPEVYEACSVMLGERAKARAMPRSIAIGCVFVAGAAGFLAYLYLYLRQPEGLLVFLSFLLLLLGVYNLLYYPFLFSPLLLRSSRAAYRRSTYLAGQTALSFFDDYIEESSPRGTNRIQWTAVQAVYREPLYYLLRLTPNTGVIVPMSALEDASRQALEALLQSKVR